MQRSTICASHPDLPGNSEGAGHGPAVRASAGPKVLGASMQAGSCAAAHRTTRLITARRLSP